MKRYFIIGCLIVSMIVSLSYAGTTGRIAGKVIDAKKEQILEGAKIVLVGSKFSAVSNDKGQYLIKDVPPGVYSIEVVKKGYKKQVIKDVKIKIDRTTKLDFKL